MAPARKSRNAKKGGAGRPKHAARTAARSKKAKKSAKPAKAAKAGARKPKAPVRAAKPKAPAKAAKPKAPAKAARPAKSSAAAKPAAKPAVKAMAPKKPAAPVKLAKVAAAAKAAAPAKTARGGRAAKPAPPRKGPGGVRRPVRSEDAPAVRPLGVLPPENRARVSDRHAAPAIVHRPPARTEAPRPDIHGAERVTEAEEKFFEERLLQERAKIMKEMGHLEETVLKQNLRDSSGELSGYSFHMADAGTDAMEREKAFLFASAEGRALLAVNEALRKLYRHEYGICESCGNPIAKARLEAVPAARLCVSCKEREEKATRTGAPVTGPGGVEGQ